MSILSNIIVVAFLLVAARAASTPDFLPACCEYPISGVSGDLYVSCVPEGWNGDVLVYAHGFVAPNVPAPEMPWDLFYSPDGTPLWAAALDMGMAFAASSYRKNGVAILEGTNDTLSLIEWFRGRYPATKNFYLAGASMGGQVAAQICAPESSPVSACLVGCSPVGSFQAALDYWGNFRAVFDFFFPGLLQGNAIDVPPGLLDDWTQPNSAYRASVSAALAADPWAAKQLLHVTLPRVPGEYPLFRDYSGTVLALLDLVLAFTADCQAELGCQPFDNTDTVYGGSSDDAALNAGVGRFARSGPSDCVFPYEASGAIHRPFVLMQGLWDFIVPYSQLPAFRKKVGHSGSLESVLMFTGMPLAEYGHCTMSGFELKLGFAVMYLESLLF